MSSDGSGLQRMPAGRGSPNSLQAHPRSDSLADVLERVLDKGIVIAGDIQIRLLDIELLTIKIRLLVASVDRAREMGINWWENDEYLTQLDDAADKGELNELTRRLEALEGRISESPQVDRSRQQRKGNKRSVLRWTRQSSTRTASSRRTNRLPNSLQVSLIRPFWSTASTTWQQSSASFRLKVLASLTGSETPRMWVGSSASHAGTMRCCSTRR
jgi:Gas vesicle protein